MSHPLTPKLQRVVELSAAMLEKGRAADWDAVIALEARRALELAGLFDHDAMKDASALLSQAIAQAIDEVLELDRELMALGQGTQRELAAELERRERGRQAHGAYRDVLSI